MKRIPPTFRLFIPAGVAGLVMLVAIGCSKPEATATLSPPPAGVSAGASGSGSGAAKAPSKLGDLSPFRSIAFDVAGIVDKGDLVAAKARIKDLELAWDSAEAGLKPRAADDWHVVDKAVDGALKALRADSPNAADCKKALGDVLAIMDSMGVAK
jgi:hypothetical protein